MNFFHFLIICRFKRSSTLGSALIVILMPLSCSISMAGSPPWNSGRSQSEMTGTPPAGFPERPSPEHTGSDSGKPYLLAALPPSDKSEYSKPDDNGTIDDENVQSDTEEPIAGPQEEAAGMNPDAGAKKQSSDPDSRQENGQKPVQNTENPVPAKENRNSGDSRVTHVPSGSQPAVSQTPDKPAPTAPSQQAKGSDFLRIIGGESIYVVKKRESLRMVGAKTGTDWRVIAKENHLDPKKQVLPGQKIIINNRKIVPKFVQNGIIINIPDRTLYLFRDNRLEKALPVGLGRKQPGKDTDWRTPTGKFSIVGKEKNPTWHAPPSIQKEMREAGRKVDVTVQPGNRNPLGKYALRTSLSGVMIHSTIHPESVYGFSSHGCIRMLPGNIEELFNDVRTRTNGEIIYQPVKVAVTGEGRVFLEVHPDFYNKKKNLETEVKRLITTNDAESRVDWNKIKISLKLKSGKAEDVTLESAPQVTACGVRRADLSPP